jgi:hypothetical protein
MQRVDHEAADPLLSLGEAARKIGIHKSTLSRQVKSGAVRSHKGKVRLSEVLADRAANINLNHSRRPKKCSPAVAGAPTSATAEAVDVVLVDGKAMPFHQAQALKETYLARLRQLEFEVKSGRLCDVATVHSVVFALARQARDAWANWPARVAPIMAAELGVDQRLLTIKLDGHVREHLGEIAHLPDRLNLEDRR